MIRAVLDVNVIVSAIIISKLNSPRLVLRAWLDNAYISVTSPAVVREVFTKLRMRRISELYGISETDAVLVAALLHSQSEVWPLPQEIAPVTGDTEDDRVLATCKASDANFLVTGDKGLLALKQYAETRIVSPADFMQELKKSSSP